MVAAVWCCVNGLTLDHSNKGRMYMFLQHPLFTKKNTQKQNRCPYSGLRIYLSWKCLFVSIRVRWAELHLKWSVLANIISKRTRFFALALFCKKSAKKCWKNRGPRAHPHIDLKVLYNVRRGFRMGKWSHNMFSEWFKYPSEKATIIRLSPFFHKKSAKTQKKQKEQKHIQRWHSLLKHEWI